MGEERCDSGSPQNLLIDMLKYVAGSNQPSKIFGELKDGQPFLNISFHPSCKGSDRNPEI
jgi:hypothetical protein